MPIEPPPTRWALPAPQPDDGETIVVGGDLAPGTVLMGYRSGLFPLPSGLGPGLPSWWSPDPRAVLPLDGLRVSRSLRRSARRYEIRVNTAFAEVIAGCADPRRPGGWIDEHFAATYGELHRLGWAHSVETWLDGELVGGLYGLAIGGLFAGESMFHRARDASKVALLALVRLLDDGTPGRLLDVQWQTDHLASLGTVEIPREEYLARLRVALGVRDVELTGVALAERTGLRTTSADFWREVR